MIKHALGIYYKQICSMVSIALSDSLLLRVEYKLIHSSDTALYHILKIFQ